MTLTNSSKNPHILLVEDNAGDAWIIRHSLEKSGVAHRLTVISDGEEASDFLEKQAGLGPAEIPDLMLLDLNLPRKSGIEVLTDIRKNPRLRLMPVVVVTSSGAERDVNTAYINGANQYFQKPRELDSIEAMMAMIAQLWLCTARLPAHTKAEFS